MADQQTMIKSAAGLYSQHNPLHSCPPGALLQAENAVIDREGVIQNRRGFARYGTALTNAPSGLYEFRRTMVVKDGTTFKYDLDAAGTWTAWSGTFSPPDTTVRIHALEVNNNFYFTSSAGVYKNDAVGGTPRLSGMPKGLDITLSLNAAITGFLAVGDFVGYRVLWTRKDANNNLIVGSPTPSLTWIENTDGANTKNIDLVITVPSGIVAGDTCEIYRSDTESTAQLLSESCYLIKKLTYASGSTISHTDAEGTLPTELELYTNDTQETNLQANDRPPWCKHMAYYKGHVFYGNFQREHTASFRIATLTYLVDGTVTIALGAATHTYTGKAAENVANHQFLVSSGGSDTSDDIRETAKSLVKCINRDTSNSTFYAEYVSLLDDLPGSIVVRCRDYDTDAFTVIADASDTGSDFEPNLTTALTSDDGAAVHKLARSKYQKPESVPWLNTMEIGRANSAILGMATLKNGLLVFKQDGIFVISGETDSSGGFTFVVDEVDPTIQLLAPESLCTLDNAVFGFTTQGIIRAYEGGSAIVSRPIELSLNPITQYQSFSTVTHGVAYESDRKYLLFCQDTNQDTYARICYVFNYLTNAWTLWRKDISCGHVLSSDQKLYLGHASDAYVLKERKSYLASNEDCQDEEFSTTVSATGTATVSGATVSTVTVTYSYTGTEMAAGWLFKYGHYEGRVVSVTNLGSGVYTLTLNDLLTLPTPSFTATLYMPIDLLVEWVPEEAGNAGLVKQFSMFQIYQEENTASVHEVGFHADTQEVREWVDNTEITRRRGWGSGRWGVAAWGDEQAGLSTPIRVAVPRNHQRCRTLRTFYRHRQAKERVSILQTTLDVRSYGSKTMRETD